MKVLRLKYIPSSGWCESEQRGTKGETGLDDKRNTKKFSLYLEGL